MNIQEIIVLILVILIAVFGFTYHYIPRKNKKKDGCNGNCHNCPYCK